MIGELSSVCSSLAYGLRLLAARRDKNSGGAQDLATDRDRSEEGSVEADNSAYQVQLEK